MSCLEAAAELLGPFESKLEMLVFDSRDFWVVCVQVLVVSSMCNAVISELSKKLSQMPNHAFRRQFNFILTNHLYPSPKRLNS